MASLPLLLLLGLLGATAAMEMGKNHTDPLQRFLDSPVVQTLADRLGLQLPEVPKFDINFQNIDINALAQTASSMGCLPEGVQFSDDARDTIRDCASQAYQWTGRTLLAQPNRRRNNKRGGRNNSRGGRNNKRGGRNNKRGGRNNKRRVARSLIDMMKEGIMARGLQMAQQCIMKGLNLQGDSGELNQTAVNALIDDMTADDNFKAQMKNETEFCISATPEDLNDSSKRLMFQLQCFSELSRLECMLVVADGVSPTLGFAARLRAGKCLAKGLEPPARAMMATAACVSEEVSSLMRERLSETAPAPASGRRRRRNADLMMALQEIGGLEGIERAIGAGSTPKPPGLPLATEELNEILARAEGVLGPLDEMFASLPERVYSVAKCWHQAMNTISDDGSVDVEALREAVAEFSGPQELTNMLTTIVSTCDESGTAGSVQSFTECHINASAYACNWLELLPRPTDE